MEAQSRPQQELQQACSARKSGNEGMARVCARRAAGIAVRDYLLRLDKNRTGLNNYEILLDESVRKVLPASLTKSLDHLTMRVDENYNLPAEIDLLSEAEYVISELSKEKSTQMEEQKTKIIMYGTSWCGGTRRARRVLEEEKIEYEWIDIDRDEIAARFVESVANGYRSVPTLIFPDGSILVEPSTYQLREKLGL